MLRDEHLRTSDAERDQAITRLSEACGEGRLTLEEYSERVKAVLASRTRGALVAITADLPGTAHVVPDRRSPKRFTISMLSDVKRKGRWKIEGETVAVSVLGSCTLDLRSALIHGNEVIIDTYVLMGSVKIIVPEGTQVEMEGFALLGSRDTKVDDAHVLPGGPIVRVCGVTVMGSVDVVSDVRTGHDRIVDAVDRLGQRFAARPEGED
jgi:Domain of unknown function (DUF1707)/Cell wall-active antibiotics response 4TMS YvqF